MSKTEPETFSLSELGSEEETTVAKKTTEKKPKAGKPAGEPKPVTAIAAPKGNLKVLDLDALTFDPDHQKRTAVYSEDTVEEYRERYEDAKEKDAKTAHEALGELFAVDTGETIYVWDGFQRGEALKRAKLKVAPVRVTKGTKGDAEWYALRANTGRGLSRSSNDARRAVLSVIDNPEMMRRVESLSASAGGLNRALAIATGTSKGHVSNVLHSRGLTTRNNRLVKLPKPPEPKPKPAEPASGVPDRPDDSAHVGGADDVTARAKPDSAPAPVPAPAHSFSAISDAHDAEAAMRELKALNTRGILGDALKTSARLLRLSNELLEREDIGGWVRSWAAACDVPIGTVTDEFMPEFGEKGGPTTRERAQWTAVAQVLKALEEVKRQLDAVNPNAARPAPEPAEELATDLGAAPVEEAPAGALFDNGEPAAEQPAEASGSFDFEPEGEPVPAKQRGKSRRAKKTKAGKAK